MCAVGAAHKGLAAAPAVAATGAPVASASDLRVASSMSGPVAGSLHRGAPSGRGGVRRRGRRRPARVRLRSRGRITAAGGVALRARTPPPESCRAVAGRAVHVGDRGSAERPPNHPARRCAKRRGTTTVGRCSGPAASGGRVARLTGWQGQTGGCDMAAERWMRW